MKRITLVLCLLPSIAYAQQTTIYGPNGQIVGRAVKSGNQTLYYNADGSRAGTTARYGNSTTFYNARGSIVGRTFGDRDDRRGTH